MYQQTTLADPPPPPPQQERLSTGHPSALRPVARHARVDGMRALRGRVATVAASLLVLVAATGTASAATADPDTRDDGGSVALSRGWRWPVEPFRLERPFVAPPHPYGPGHRGVDLRPLDDDPVAAPAPGVVAFSGQVAGRPVITIDHGDGLVTTLEPVTSDLAAGTAVAASAAVGVLTGGGHTEPGVLHFGVRLDGEYINPLVLLGGVPRAVLLPCC